MNPDDESSVPSTLLLVADDLMFPSRIREGLRGQSWTVRVVSNAAGVLPAVHSGTLPDVILVNLNGRRFDPLAVISMLKADASGRSIPVLAFAGHAETEKHQAARAAGADRTAANSSVSLHLAAVLKHFLRQHATGYATTEEIIEIGEESDAS